MSRYVRATKVTFADLAKFLHIPGPIHAVEVDHMKGTVNIVHHGVKGIPDGAEPPLLVVEHRDKVVIDHDQWSASHD